MSNELVRVVFESREKYKTISLKPIEDPRLSWRSKGIHTWLISRPDDWEVRIEYFKKQAHDGKTSMNSGIQELKFFNYLYIHRPRNERGQYTGDSVWYVTENPKELPIWECSPVKKEKVIQQGPKDEEIKRNSPSSGNTDSGNPNPGDSQIGQSASTRGGLGTNGEVTTKERSNAEASRRSASGRRDADPVDETETVNSSSEEPDGESPSLPHPDELQKTNGSYNYPDDFLTVWNSYPDREGPSGKLAAYRNFRARVSNGVSLEDLINATKTYRDFCRNDGRTGTEYVMMAKTFFGPDCRFREYFDMDRSQFAETDPSSLDYKNNREEARVAFENQPDSVEEFADQ